MPFFDDRMSQPSFDTAMWRYIRQSLTEKRARSRSVPSEQAAVDYDELEDHHLDELWDDLKSEKYHRVCEQCQIVLTTVEQDLADDFGEDLQTFTLFDDPHEDRREAYLKALRLYQFALRGRLKELILHTKDLKDIDVNLESYSELRQEIQKDISTVTYLLGSTYDHTLFFLPSDLEELDRLMREHCEFLLKQEFFRRIQFVTETLGPLERKDFQRITEPYKNLRELCDQCLEILTMMRDSRFFGEYDTFIEDYERDVRIYLQILWYLAIKTDLNKIEKFLHPNTYSEGLDEFCQVFAAIALLEEVIPHLDAARQIGLSDNAVTILLADYAEYLATIITHETEKHEKKGIQQLLETDKLLAEGGMPEGDQKIDLTFPEGKREQINETYASLDDLRSFYRGQIENMTDIDLTSQEFEELLEKAARGIGLREEPGEQDAHLARKAYRYHYDRGVRGPEPAVFIVQEQTVALPGKRFLHKEWVADLYEDWKKRKTLTYMQQILDQHTQKQEKTRYRIDFAIKLFKKQAFAIKLGEHKRIAVPNPNGRVLRSDARVEQFLQALHKPVFARFFEDLKATYQSRDGVKIQQLRWDWFAERELPAGCFETPKYDYLSYIHTRWQEKLEEHYRTLDQFTQSKRDNNEEEDD